MTALLVLWLALSGGGDRSGPVHAALVASVPAADSVARTVRELRLVFSEAVEPGFSTITLSGPAGPVATTPIEAVPNRGGVELLVRLAAPLSDGSYTVAWRTAGPDGHAISGSFGFQVEAVRPSASAEGPSAQSTGTSTGAGPPAAPPDVAAPPLFLSALVRWILYATTTAMVGLAVFRWAVLEPLRHEMAFAMLAFPALRRAWALGWTVAALALVLLPLRLGIEALELFGSDAIARASGILASRWGLGWWVEVVAAGLLVVGLAISGTQGRRRGWILVGIAALLSTLVPALSGHASADQRLGGLAVLNDALHVAGAGAWIGGLALVLLVGLPAAREADIPRQLAGGLHLPAAMLVRFSKLAVPAVALVVATGLVNAWIQVGSWRALTETSYGRTLLVKLALVAPTALIGLYHWRRIRPAIEAGAAPERLRPTAVAEVALALIVLGVTAVLAFTPPPR